MYYRHFQSFRTTRKSLNLWNHKSKGTRQENENGHLVVFPWAPFGSFSDSPCFRWLRELWGMLVSCLGECPSISICLLLSRLDWDSCLGRKGTEVRCHLHHMELLHPVNVASHGHWDRPAEVVFVSFPTVKRLLLPISMRSSWEGSDSVRPRVRSGELVSASLIARSHVICLEFLCVGDLSTLLFVFIYSIIIYISTDLWIFILYLGF